MFAGYLIWGTWIDYLMVLMLEYVVFVLILTTKFAVDLVSLDCFGFIVWVCFVVWCMIFDLLWDYF